MEEQMVKGLILKSRVEFLNTKFGKGALEKVLALLRGETLEVMRDPLKIRSTGWYNFSINTELDDAIFRTFGKGDMYFFRKMGGFSNEFQDEHSVMDIFKGPWKYLNHHAVAFPRFWKPGRMEVIKVNDHEAVVRFHNVRSTKENCLTNIGFLETGLRMCGCRNIRIEELRCVTHGAELCEFSIIWDYS